MLNKLSIVAITFFLLAPDDAIAQLSHVFTEEDRIENKDAWYVASSANDVVFMSDPFSGVYTYDWMDGTFTNERAVDLLGNEGKVVVRDDSTLFIATSNTLFAYSYNDSLMSNIGQIGDSKFFTSVAVGPGKIVFATTSFGLRAYEYSDATFSLLASDDGPIFDNSKHIVVGDDSTIYVAGGGNGFFAFSFYGDSTFTPLDTLVVNQAEGVTIASDGTIFLANSNVGGVLAYRFDGASFDSLAQWREPQGALDLAVGPDGTVFVANSLDGLRALTFDGTTFINTAHISSTGSRGVSVGRDGTVFVAEGTGGWAAYSYAAATGLHDNFGLKLAGIRLAQNFPNPVSGSTSIQFSLESSSEVRLNLYDIQGRIIRKLVNAPMNRGTHSVDLNVEGLANGMYLYRISTPNENATKTLVVMN